MSSSTSTRWSTRTVVALALAAGSLLGLAVPAGAAEGVGPDPSAPVAPDDVAPRDRLREPRIVHGEVAPAGAWPAQAAILVNRPDGAYFTCGGTVIDRSWVLTAAHCVNRPDPDPAYRFIARPQDIDVLVGTQDLRSGGTRIRSVEIRVIPGWDYEDLDRDVALIRLDRPVPSSITPVPLASTNPAAGTDVMAIGWGDLAWGNGTGTPVLRQAELDVLSDGECGALYGTLLVADTMLCADRYPAGTCQGDSGGPLLELRNGTWTVVGIDSWAYRCGEGYPSVFAQVSTFAPWIRWQIRYGPHPNAGAFVKRQYLDLFGRQPTSTELFYGVAALEDGQSTAAFVAGLLDGPTFRARSGGIVRLYKAIFLREPDSGGLTYWMGKITSGVSLKRIADQMVGAPEFTTLYGHLDHGGFVDLVYDNVLDRMPSDGDRDYWIGELASGRRTRGQVMVGFSESAEYRALTDPTTRVTAAFWALVRRVPSTAETGQWRGRPAAEVARFLLSSYTYANRF